MGEFRWILLGLGVVALAGIYAFSRYRLQRSGTRADRSRDRVEPVLGSNPPAPGSPAADAEVAVESEAPAPVVPEKVVAIRLMSKDRSGFPGDKLVLAMRGEGLRHGQFGIFHAYQGDTESILFSVANLVEPGSFDLSALTNTRLPGVSLFLILPGPDDSIGAFETMVETARSLAASLDGELLDEQGSSLSIQRERYIRDEIQQFVHEHLTTAATAGSPV